MKEKYKRYMIFTWSEYDNVSPFDAFYGDFDSLDDAKECVSSKENEWIFRKDDDDNSLFCIFDRFKGEIIK